ncbi:MAG: decarboxylating NADP(+)-dependent phosphogluconate dehydrogenase [Planctomycetes bacterium]|nr:decarboxylating NADP(+)-dependent phosphogluconate dehydrogenase [Planctomycetota bacterium]
MSESDIGLVGLAVMGENLVMNMESKGFTVSVFNRTVEKVTRFVEGRARGLNIVPAYSLEELVKQLKKPRKVMLMVKAGVAVDHFIDKLVPLLDPGDIIIDGGNSHYADSERRTKQVENLGLLYIGSGVSGGEEGALKGPSIMPGGSRAAWPEIAPIFQTIAARAPDGSPCCQWVGSGGAGHFVKMVHNGIEYGDMQLICEAYQLLRDGLGLSAEQMQPIFAEWNKGELNSYLIEITADILGFKDADGEPLVDKILDTAGQKGTGKWTVDAALEQSVAVTLIAEAVFSRILSSVKEVRVDASAVLTGPDRRIQVEPERRAEFIECVRQALFAAKIVSYAQGYQLMRTASGSKGWDLNYGEIALMWRSGCIIRSAFLDDIKRSFDSNPTLANLLLDNFFCNIMDRSQSGWRQVVSKASLAGIPVPAMSSALAYFDAYRCARLPANLLQAQRDYFGAHTYERLDAPRGEFFHTNWTGEGGDTASTTYVI